MVLTPCSEEVVEEAFESMGRKQGRIRKRRRRREGKSLKGNNAVMCCDAM
jgi:hypothetical protein